MSDVTVITATTLPERDVLLAEAVQSVANQTVPADNHVIGVDYVRSGGARVYNLLAAGVPTTWTALLPDDDVLYPTWIERHLAESDGADIVYSYCDVTGDDPWDQYNQPFSADLLRRLSIVSHVALVRTDLILELGGWDDGAGYDWRFWVKALDAGARFRSIPERLWRYRLDTNWRHESRPWINPYTGRAA